MSVSIPKQKMTNINASSWAVHLRVTGIADSGMEVDAEGRGGASV